MLSNPVMLWTMAGAEPVAAMLARVTKTQTVAEAKLAAVQSEALAGTWASGHLELFLSSGNDCDCGCDDGDENHDDDDCDDGCGFSPLQKYQLFQLLG